MSFTSVGITREPPLRCLFPRLDDTASRGLWSRPAPELDSICERLKHSYKTEEDAPMKIRGEEVRLPCSMIGGYPRPHWLQGRGFGSLHEPLHRSMDLRIAYEDAVRLAAQDQEPGGLGRLADAQQYRPPATPAVQTDAILHYNTAMP